eukprot:TRINITY_DN313_c0_g1_i12.p1 TRINITY_DN313_c0_g1~~TRINITY_DN313_c0_g1_i12.p1  ORF type:complete len:185 (-),score=42.94 TRINITY_DN313_c0_g1_i12:50-604(-)
MVLFFCFSLNYQGGPPIAEDEDDEFGAIRAPGGYYYFGAAKDLPGVKELLKPKKQVVAKRTRYDMYQRIDVDYYGYRDDEDGLLEKLEEEAEKKGFFFFVETRVWYRLTVNFLFLARIEAIEDWNRIQTQKWGDLDLCPFLPPKITEKANEYKVHIGLPTQEEIEQELLKKRKEEMLRRYLSSV